MAKKRRKARDKAPPSPSAAAPDSTAAQEAPAAHPRGRRAANLFIAAFLAYQLIMPLSYYVSGGGYDERFSWRMFSSVRMQRCKARVTDVSSAGGTREVPLASELHVAWIRILARARPAAIEKYLRKRCQAQDVARARYDLQCVGPDDRPLPDRQVALDCDSGALQDDLEERP